MEYVKLGATGLDVSRVCLGCMSYGLPDRGNHEWTLTEDASRPFLRAAVEAGINFFGMANVASYTPRASRPIQDVAQGRHGADR